MARKVRQAGPAPLPEAPARSAVNQPAETYTDPTDGIDGVDLDKVHIIEIDRRLALMGRLVLEAALRSRDRMSLKDKADIAIRTINVVEGAKQRVELWARDMEREVPKTVEQYEAERQAVEARLRMLLERKGSITRKETVDAALDVLSTEQGEN